MNLVSHDDIRRDSRALDGSTIHCLSAQRISPTTVVGEVHLPPPFACRVQVLLFKSAEGWRAIVQGKPQIDGEKVIKDDRGKVRYQPILAWDTPELDRRFSAAVIAAIERYDASVLSTEARPAALPKPSSGEGAS